MVLDLSDYLNNEHPWNGERKIIVFNGEDGKQKIQVRQRYGIDQMEMDGRPDGQKPFGKDSFLDYYIGELKKHQNKYKTADGFVINPDGFRQLDREAVDIDYRCELLWSLSYFSKVVRDAEHVIKIMDLVYNHAQSAQERMFHEKSRPMFIKLKYDAKSRLAEEEKNYAAALESLREGIFIITNLSRLENPEFLFEKNKNLAELNSRVRDLFSAKEREEQEEPKAKLKRELSAAVKEEEFEKAARIREELKMLEKEADQEE